MIAETFCCVDIYEGMGNRNSIMTSDRTLKSFVGRECTRTFFSSTLCLSDVLFQNYRRNICNVSLL